jgi:Family of unknown function (DUF5995)
MISTFDDAIDRMQSIADSTGPGDGIGVFNMVYQRTSAAIRDRLGTGFFDDDDFIARLGIIFAELYFAAVDADSAGQRVSAAWRPLFAQRSDRRVQAVQFAVAGMNTHINHDLELAVIHICAAEHTHPLAGSIPADYHRITDILEEIQPMIRRALSTDPKRNRGEPPKPMLHLISSWNIRQARQAAWVQAQVLWPLRDTPLFHEAVAISASTVGMTTHHLLTPLLRAAAEARHGGVGPGVGG